MIACAAANKVPDLYKFANQLLTADLPDLFVRFQYTGCSLWMAKTNRDARPDAGDFDFVAE